MAPPKMRRAASAKATPNAQDGVDTDEAATSPPAIQARKLRRAYFFCVETAITVARLAYGVAQ